MAHVRPFKREVMRAIRNAFAGVCREDGVTLHEARSIDDYGGDQERADARKLDEDSRWEQVPAEHIEKLDAVLSFLDAKGFRYYIPAYMIWTLRHLTVDGPCPDFNANSIDATFRHLEKLEHPEEIYSSRMTLLNSQQREAISLFLLYASRDPNYGDEAKSSLDRFWRRFLPLPYRQ